MPGMNTVWKKVVLFGDSLTQFSFSPESPWGALIADKLQRKCDVLNRGFSGYNSTWCQIILPHVVDARLANETVAMVIFLGANDSNLYKGNPHQHVPLEDYKNNLLQMINYLHSVGLHKDHMILVSPPPCDEDKWSTKCLAEGKIMAKDNWVTGQYAVACQETAEQGGIGYIDLYKYMLAQEDWSRYLSDGLHLSPEGSRFLFDKLWPLIEKRTNHLPDLNLPDWKTIDSKHPEASLLS